MRSRPSVPFPTRRSEKAGAPFIAIGLMMLLAQLACGTHLIASAFSCIALGAAFATIGRGTNVFARRGLVAANALLYASLYLVAVGALLDLHASNSTAVLSVFQWVDLGLSAALFVWMLRTSYVAVVAPSQTTT